MSGPADVVFLLDCDNTLLDNDRVQQDLRTHLERQFGATSAVRYWELFEQLRVELGYADYLGALQRYRNQDVCDMRLLHMSSFLLDYPFMKRLYPRALEVIAHLAACGTCVLLSDGDVVFQPRKVERAGLWQAFGGRVLIYIHKEQMLDEVARRYPARHFVMVDDKPRLLDAIKRQWGAHVTTVFPRQGHYALAPRDAAQLEPDITIDAIGDLMQIDPAALRLRACSTSPHR
ncbi:haloacid dehalogenase [Janthinobacterium sp. ROICE36]|uniref:HAD family hydrolase n=1 Tax=Janthinobacterium sp. ROICE36 TaxID=2048670 RepID=UPI000C7F1845|nr:HAD family hydrolase [Janthinobacterium sp. ROICE36]PLY39608.1 haloacid dehalogenase [Janthinobacterium sp. ROICE36]